MTSKSCGINYVSFSFRFEVSWPMKKGWIFRSSKPRSFHQWNDALAWTTPQFLAVQAMQDVELLWWHLRGAWSWKMDRMMMFLPYRSPPRPEGNNYCSTERGKTKGSNVSLLGICWGQHTRWVCLKTASPENLIDLLPKFRQFEVLFEGHLPFLKLI